MHHVCSHLGSIEMKWRKLTRQQLLPYLSDSIGQDGFASPEELGKWDECLATTVHPDQATAACVCFDPAIYAHTDYSGADMAMDAFQHAVSILSKVGGNPSIPVFHVRNCNIGPPHQQVLIGRSRVSAGGKEIEFRGMPPNYKGPLNEFVVALFNMPANPGQRTHNTPTKPLNPGQNPNIRGHELVLHKFARRKNIN